jgi:hypothetical protein
MSNEHGQVRVFKYICHDCITVFHVHNPKSVYTRKYCPDCGEYFGVKPIKKEKRPRRNAWTPEEVADLDKVIRGEAFLYQVAIKWGRTQKAVGRKKLRRIHELRELAEKENGKDG